MSQSQSRRWCFTINNFTPQHELALTEIDCRYLVYGRERGESGTLHLQGFIVFSTNQRFNAVRALFGTSAYLEAARGSSKQASDYCKKDGDFAEYGELPDSQGKRTDFDEYLEWCQACTSPPSQREIIRAFSRLYARYKKALMDIAQEHAPRLTFEVGEPRDGWQSTLETLLEEEPADDRSIQFYVDPDGNSGKSWMCKYFLNKYTDCQMIRPGKEMDMAYEIDETNRIFLFDVPRSKMEHFQYSVLEALKDRMIFSGKYESRLKRLRHVPHVLVFCNEQPDMEKLSLDRYNIINV